MRENNMSNKDLDLSKKIYRAALDCGFDRCGIISVDELDGFEELFRERKQKVPAAGMFHMLTGGFEKTKKRFPWAKSVIICSYWYGKYRYPEELRGRYAKDFFLMPEDHPQKGYDHIRFETWLKEQGIRFAGGEQFKYYSIGPLRYAAVKAGLGIMRKNNFFYTEKGSHNLLMGYVIDRACELIRQTDLEPCNEKCDLCRKACKTKALSAPFTINPFKCVSFWTTFGKGIVPPYLKADMFEEWMCGCDNCQDACPFNRKKDWNEGESFSDLEEIAADLVPEKVIVQSDDYLIRRVIAKTDHHLKPSDAPVLRRNAKRAIRFRKRKNSL